MFQTKNPAYKLILIIALVFIAAALVLAAMSVINSDKALSTMLAFAIKVAALIFAVYYIIAGFSKDVAKHYKTFAGIFAASQIFSIAELSQNNNNYFAALVAALILTAILILLCSKDLGKKASLTVAIILVALTLISLLTAFLNQGNLIVYGSLVNTFVLACLLLIMTFAKYLDKAARGTK